MKCPYCAHLDSKVVDSRDSDTGEAIRRRRECLDCGKRFTTYERVEAMPLWVVKKDGRREEFSRAKLLGGLVNATAKRDVPHAQLESIIDDIENTLRTRNVTGGPDLTLYEVNEAAQLVSESADPDAQIIFGTVIDEQMKGEVKITVIATGFTGQIDVLGTLAYEPTARPVPVAQPAFTIGGRGATPANADDLDIPAFLRDRR